MENDRGRENLQEKKRKSHPFLPHFLNSVTESCLAQPSPTSPASLFLRGGHRNVKEYCWNWSITEHICFKSQKVLINNWFLIQIHKCVTCTNAFFFKKVRWSAEKNKTLENKEPAKLVSTLNYTIFNDKNRTLWGVLGVCTCITDI